MTLDIIYFLDCILFTHIQTNNGGTPRLDLETPTPMHGYMLNTYYVIQIINHIFKYIYIIMKAS